MLRFCILQRIIEMQVKVVHFIAMAQCEYMLLHGQRISKSTIQKIIYYKAGSNNPINYNALCAMAKVLSVSVSDLDLIQLINPINNAA